MYIYNLSNESKQLIRTASPDRLIDLDMGIYAVDDVLKNTLRGLWQSIDEYTGILSLEVING